MNRVVDPGTADRPESSALERLQTRLGVRFADQDLLAQALVHRSYAFENGGLVPNERLEFLGDAVLALVVTDEIYHLQADSAEGRLAKLRAAAVKAGSLAEIARGLDLGAYVRLGKGEDASGGRGKDSILADTLEAVFGAYYLDRGFVAAYDLVQRLFAGRLTRLIESRSALDFKTALQELAAARYTTLPVYEVTAVGPDHAKTFTAVVHVDGRRLGEGTGRNKKQAEQRAARAAHGRLCGDDEASAGRVGDAPGVSDREGTGGSGTSRGVG